MNDSINIKIGAEDAGFENTLKTVQDELKSLEGKVNSGDLSFKELERTMKKIGQVEDMEKRLKAMGGESSEAGTKVDKLGKDITDTGNKAEKTGSMFDASFAKIAGAVAVGELAVKAFGAVLNAAFAAARSVVEGFKAALDLGGTLSDLSAQTGESAGNLLLMQRAFDNTGLGAEKVGPVLAKLAASINNTDEESKKAALGFGRMGISLDELQGKSATEQLILVSTGLQSIKDPGERAAAAIAVFGKSGADLLPLLSNFQGEMNEASATVGSLADVMDRRAAVFDAISDRFKVIQEKVRDFAAGILDKALPAIDAITSALSRIDAAAVGQKLADAFLGGQKAMSGFQAAVDAISIGKAGLAFEAFWESLKLQAMQTSDQIYKTLTAAFQTAGNYIGTIFSPSGALFQTLISGAEFLGNKMSAAIQRNLSSALAGNWLTESIALQLNKGANEANTAANKIEDSLKGAGTRIADQFGKAGEALPKSFEENFAKVPPLFADLTEQQAKVAAIEGKIKTAVAATNDERAAGAAQTEAELARRQEIKAAAEAAAASERSAKTELVELETQINLAKASGNEELIKSLESQKKELENQAEIKKLTAEYQKTLGVNGDEAARLANNFVAAANAANSIANKNAVVTVTTKVNRQEYDDLMAAINAGTKDPKTLEVLAKITGKEDFNEAYQTLQSMQAINKNFDVALKVSGSDSLQELYQNLNGIPTTKQIQLGMEITGKDTYDEVVKSLPSFAGTRTAKLLLDQAGFENMTQFLNTLKGVPDEKRTKVIAEALGVPDVDNAKAALDRVLINDGKTATINVAANTAAADENIAALKQGATDPITIMTMADISKAISEIDKTKQTALQPLTMNLQGDASGVSEKIKSLDGNPVQLNLQADDTAAAQKINLLDSEPLSLTLNGDTAEVQASISSLTANPTTLTLDASASIESIKKQFKEGIDTAINGSEGSKILTTISGFVETIKDLVEKIEPKLPVAALV